MTYKKVKLIEKASLDLSERVELLLVYADVKPATEIPLLADIKKDNYDKNNQIHKLGFNDINKIKKLMHRLNISFTEGPIWRWTPGYKEYKDGRIEPMPDVERLDLFISRDSEKSKRLKVAYYSWDNIEEGKLYGFPETAIQAYLGKRNLFLGDLFEGHPYGYFTSYVQSQEYFKEELEECTWKWHDTVKRLSPSLYKEVKDIAIQLKWLHHKSNLAWRDEDFVYYSNGKVRKK